MERKSKKEIQPKKNQTENILRQDIISLCKNKAGIRFFKYLMRESGFAENSVVISAAKGDISKDCLLYNEARRDFYIQLRKKIPKEFLVEIEIND